MNIKDVPYLNEKLTNEELEFISKNIVKFVDIMCVDKDDRLKSILAIKTELELVSFYDISILYIHNFLDESLADKLFVGTNDQLHLMYKYLGEYIKIVFKMKYTAMTNGVELESVSFAKINELFKEVDNNIIYEIHFSQNLYSSEKHASASQELINDIEDSWRLFHILASDRTEAIAKINRICRVNNSTLNYIISAEPA